MTPETLQNNLILILILLFLILAARSYQQLRKRGLEWESLGGDASDFDISVVREQRMGWGLWLLASILWLAAAVLLYIFDTADPPEPYNVTDLVVPLFALGFIATVVRQEVGMRMQDQRRRMVWAERRDTDDLADITRDTNAITRETNATAHRVEDKMDRYDVTSSGKQDVAAEKQQTDLDLSEKTREGVDRLEKKRHKEEGP